MITYCFDSAIHPVPNNKLQTDIYAHGGSMTNIFAAMKRLDNELKKIPRGEEVKVCFVSDGQDTCNGYLDNMLKELKGSCGRKITFMCVGVQSGFPTKVSMFLREKYHRGDASVPSIFLIEYASDKAFFNKFQSVKQYCTVKTILKVEPPQRLFPWVHPVGEIVEDLWIMSQNPEITLNGHFKITYDDSKFSVEAICDVFRSWSQKLQLDSLNKKITFAQAQEYAASCNGLMENIIKDVQESRGLDIISGKTTEKQDFLSQVLNLQVVRTSQKINGYLTAVREIRDGKDLSKLNEYDTAKIIGLGTVVGKAQQRALALKTMNTALLRTYIEEFITEVQKITLNPETGFQNSFQSNTNFRTLLADSTLPSGLRKFHSPLDFLSIFPLFGLAVNVKRNEGAITNAWKVSTKSYDSSALELDTSTFDFATHKFITADQTEYNAVCPLIPEQDAYLAPLYNTNLMRYIISYNTTEQLDGIEENSWVVLLSDLFVLAMNNDDEATLKKVMDTFSAIKNTNKYVQEVLEKIEVGDSSVYSNFHNRSTFLALHYFYLTDHQEEDVDPEEMEEYMQKLWIFYFSDRLKNETISAFVQTEQASNLKNHILAKYTPEHTLSQFYTSKSLVRYMKKGILDEMNQIAAESTANSLMLIPGAFTADTNKDISFKLIKKLVRRLMKNENLGLSDNESFIYLAHIGMHKENSLEIPLEIDSDEAKQFLATQFQQSSSSSMKKKVSYVLTDILQKQYFKYFKLAHWNTLPKKWDEIVAICNSKGIDSSKLEWDAGQGMVRNACMSDGCPHQFVPRSKKKLRNHLGGWQGLCPRAFHSFTKDHLGLGSEEIYTQFLNLRGIKDIGVYGVTKEKVIEYIDNVKTKFNE